VQSERLSRFDSLSDRFVPDSVLEELELPVIEMLDLFEEDDEEQQDGLNPEIPEPETASYSVLEEDGLLTASLEDIEALDRELDTLFIDLSSVTDQA
ncbi:MAG: hypothetical protein R3207_07500, partial [Oceanospirillum sp.]|nr:hypothetical protein [Oceanospirillum sp.]